MAVDYLKSGSPAIMARHLRSKKFPHWLEKEPHYHSNSVVGKIYDSIGMNTEDMEWHPAHDKPFDKRILSRYQLDNATMEKASEVKAKYDIAMRRLMGQHEAPVTEFEIWSTFILSKPRVGSDYKLQENVGRDVSALKERFRTLCIDIVKGVEQKQSYVSCTMADREKLDQFVAAMYTVTYNQVQAALRDRTMPRVDDEGEAVEFQMPLISFPWLFHRELARVALGREGDVRPLRRPALAEVSHQAKHDVQIAVPAADSSGTVEDINNPVEIIQEGSGAVNNNKGVVGSQSTTGTTASTSSGKISQPAVIEAQEIPVQYTLDGGHEYHDDDDDDDFEEVDFEEVVDVSVQEEEDAIDVLAKKIGM